MPDNDDLRMNQNEALNCKLALMGVWTEACREAAAYFGVNPDGSGNFSPVTQAQAGSTAGTLAVDGISADEMTSRLAASLVEHFPDKTDIITGDPAACTRAAQNISARGRAFADKVKCVPFVLSAAAQGISDAVRDAAELMGKGYEEIKAAAAKDPRSVAAAAKHCADATANVPTRHLPKASHGAHMG